MIGAEADLCVRVFVVRLWVFVCAGLCLGPCKIGVSSELQQNK